MRKLLIYSITFSVFVALVTFLITRPYALNSNKIFNMFFNNVYRKIDYVEIVGNNLVSTEDIVFCLYTMDKKDSFILKDKQAIINSLKNFSTIETVTLKYTLPTKLTITIKERDPIMFYHDSYGKVKIIDSNFNEFYDSHVKLEYLIYLRGKYRENSVIKLLQVIAKFPLIYENLTEIENFFDYRFNIILNNRVEVLLPDDETEQYFNIISSYITKYNFLKTNVYRIDFRNKNKVFLASNKNVVKYEPTPTQYVVYRENYTRDGRYRNTINNALARIK
jgi:cell division septal protein FtsQ